MAVTVTSVRNHATDDLSTFRVFATLTLSGTYVTGGFAFNPINLPGGLGSSPLPSTQMLDFDSRSPKGYIYVFVGTGYGAGVIKIFSAPGTELANTTAVPDASLPVLLTLRKV